MRRIVKEKDLYEVNNAVDILNIISIQSGYSIGGYDSSKISGNIKCEIGNKDISYVGIGRGVLNISLLPVLSDDNGPFGTPTSDSERTMVTFNTNRFLMVFFNFNSDMDIDYWMNNAKTLLVIYASANEFKQLIF